MAVTGKGKKKSAARKSAPKAEKVKEVEKSQTAVKRKAEVSAEESSPVGTKKSKLSKTPGLKKSTKASVITTKAKPALVPEAKPDTDVEVESEDEAVSSPNIDDGQDSEDRALALIGEVANEDDEEEENVPDAKLAFKEGQDVGKAPDVSLSVRAAAKSGKGGHEDTGIVYVGRIPHGFYEHEMRSYFSQFGDVVNLRLSRNKKTGQSKHYAFIQFTEESTAEIVAKTMDNYLLFGHILKCKLVPKSSVHTSLWKGANRRFKRIPVTKLAGEELKKPKTESEWEAKISRVANKRARRAEKLEEMDYEYEIPQLKPATAAPTVAAVEGGEVEDNVPKASETQEHTDAPKAVQASNQTPAVDDIPDHIPDERGDGVDSLDADSAVGKKVTEEGKTHVSKSTKRKRRKTKKVKV